MHLLVFLLFSLVSLTVGAAEITKLRVWQAPDQTRFVFDLSAPTDFEVFPVADPHRVVIDLAKVVSRDSLKLPPGLTQRVRGLRHGRTPQGGVRVVLDLEHAVEVRHILLPPRAQYGHRLVVDVIDPPGLVRRPVAPPAVAKAAPATKPAAPAPVVTAAPVTPTAPVIPGAQIAPTPVASADTTPAWRQDGVVIAIDAGHGGDDVGAIGPRGTYEKDVVLAIARELQTLINREPGMRAVMIRDGDYYVGLRQRIERAREHRADMFVSIHADAFRDRRVKGSSVFVISRSGASSEAARWLAERENAADLVGGVTLEDKDPQLRSVLLDLSQTKSLETSLTVANAVLGSLRKVGAVHSPRVQQAGFMVLKSPDIPSLLVETAFISNPTEEQRLRNQAFRRKLATAIRDGITRYFDDAAPARQRMASREIASAEAAAAEARRHRVSRGETLSGIALHYSVSPEHIRLANNKNDDVVRIGELLRIP